ncbi:glucose-6-phosphate isomerase [Couchioplanes caeruleus]|uniref:glucose-6-phosphate isomerase n=1 Tax=Couchioplanes caeruleus TaxID=56438 RepID=UPI0020C13D5F|nr:glucose-6-phosphate isomerase [Couchioplanes caeruleus]UQU63045.1 glucose-6-phosphate isomerase [Couchioplanes caeruleus]
MTIDPLAAVEAAAGLAVFGAPATASRHGRVDARLAGLDAGPDPLALDPALLPQLAELHEELGDLDHVVLAGPGRAAEAIARTLGRRLTVLDDPDPRQVLGLTRDRDLMCRSVTVFAEDAGDLHRVLHRAYLDLGLTEAETARHLLPLGGSDALLEAPGQETLVAATLAGIDAGELTGQSAAFAPSVRAATGDNPALALGLALAGADAVALVADGSGLEGLGEWAAPLLTAAGLVPVVAEAPDSPGVRGEDVLTVSYGGSLRAGSVPGGGARPDVAVNGPLGAQFAAWRWAAAIAGRLRGAEPPPPPGNAAVDGEAPSWTDGAVEIFTTRPRTDLSTLLREFGSDIHDHLSVVAVLDPVTDAEVAALRPLLAAATGRPVTLDRDPGHVGDLRNGSFLQITGADPEDVDVPGRAYTLGGSRSRRAAAARQALTRRGRPLLRLHLTDRRRGVRQLLAAAGMLQARACG